MVPVLLSSKDNQEQVDQSTRSNSSEREERPDSTVNDSRLNESSQSDIWSDSREITMSTQEQVAKLTEIAARLEKMPSVPRIRIKQLELPEQWEDWKYVF